MPAHPLHGTSLDLASSLIRGLGGKTHHHDLASLTSEIAKARHVVLFLIDGLGYDRIAGLPARSFLGKECKAQLQSVFPSATTAAITTLLTGLSPIEHGVAGWYTYFPEIEDIGSILTHKTRSGEKLKLPRKILPSSLLNQTPVRKQLIIKKNLAKSQFNSLFIKWDEVAPFQNMSGMFRALRKSVEASQGEEKWEEEGKERTFTYMYWGGYDDLSHLYSKQHEKSQAMLVELDKRLQEFVAKNKFDDVLLIVTADHGQITTTRKKTILLNKDAAFANCLRLPCAGEPRALFCYVKPELRQFFEKYVGQKYRDVLTVCKTSEILAKFGPGKAHPLFLERTGDYILLAKENYALRFYLKDEPQIFYPGHHGGLSAEETMVPLIVKKL